MILIIEMKLILLLTMHRCWVAGYGSNFFNGNSGIIVPTLQREVDVPIVDQNNCQNLLRATRLGSGYNLDFTSFMCAGAEQGKGWKKF
jgi:hypothetical protein